MSPRERITKVEWYSIHNGRCWTYWLELDHYVWFESWKRPRD